MAVRDRGTGDIREYYEAYWNASVQPRYEPDAALMALIQSNVERDSRCLDVGCGAGQTYAALLERTAGSYTGVDVSEAAIELARASGLQAQVIDDASTLPFENDAFDVAICVEVLEHLFAPHEAVREIRRVLRPHGKLIVSTPNSAYWRLRANLLFGIWNPLGDSLSLEQPWRDPHIRFFSPSIMQHMLEQAGFTNVTIGAHGGCFLDHLTSKSTSFGVSPVYKRMVRRFPSLFGLTIHALAVK